MKHSIIKTGATALGLAVFFILPISVHAATAPVGFSVNTVVSGLTLPTSFAFAPDGRIFIAQKGGSVRVVKNGALLPTPLVTLPDVNDFADRGLESIALDPDFAHNGFVYLAYTYENTPGQNYTGPKTGRIIRLTTVGDTASLATKVVILGSIGGDAAHPSCRNFATTSDCIPSDANTHSMGDMHFGQDGKLYATLGDGAGYLSVDPLALDAQDVNSLGGKIVRINSDGTGVADNPFWSGNGSDNRSKVWSLGHRNSYRFTMRPSDGKIFFGDVGWATWEELDVGAKGANYGWPCREGHVATAYNCTPSSTATEPIYVYDHSAGSGSVIGGSFPSSYFAGNYFFGDYSNDYIKRVVLNSNDTTASVNNFISQAGGPVDIQTGPDGNLYYAAINVGELRTVVGSGTGGTTGTTGGPNQSADPTPHFVSASVAPDSVIGHQETLTATVRNDGGAGPFIVDLEVVNANAPTTLVVQKTYEGVSLAQGATGTYTLQWLPPSVGNYYLKVGLFKQNWAGLWEWTEQALPIVVTDRSGTGQNGPAAPHLVSATGNPAAPTAGVPQTLTATVRNDAGTQPFLVDLEVYNAQGTKVAQQFYDGASIATNATHDYTLAWTPPAAGDYTLKVGLFGPGWSSLSEWSDAALALHVAPASGGGGGGGGTTAAPKFSATVKVDKTSGSAQGGDTIRITATVTDTGGAGDGLMDIEVIKDPYIFGQQVVNDQHFNAGETKVYIYDFPVPFEGQYGVTSTGDYHVDFGVMHTDWSSPWAWYNSAALFTVTNP